MCVDLCVMFDDVFEDVLCCVVFCGCVVVYFGVGNELLVCNFDDGVCVEVLCVCVWGCVMVSGVCVVVFMFVVLLML